MRPARQTAHLVAKLRLGIARFPANCREWPESPSWSWGTRGKSFGGCLLGLGLSISTIHGSCGTSVTELTLATCVGLRHLASKRSPRTGCRTCPSRGCSACPNASHSRPFSRVLGTLITRWQFGTRRPGVTIGSGWGRFCAGNGTIDGRQRRAPPRVWWYNHP